MRTHVQRRDFFKLGAAGLTGAGAASLIAAPARGPSRRNPPRTTSATCSSGSTAELVCEAFYRRAIAEGDWTRGERRRLALARDGDTRHLRTLNGVLAPQGPVMRTDFEIRFPAGTFSSRERILAQGEKLEKLVVGVYIDGVTNAADPGPARCWRGC